LSWTNEDRLLLYCCRTDRDDQNKEEIIETERKGIDWDHFLKKTRENGISGIVYRNLDERRRDYPNVPSTILEELKSEYYLNAANNALIFEELEKVLEAFKKSGLQIIVLKGAALASIVYKNLALRPMSDVDLLVKKEDLLGIDEKLRMSGYEPLDMPARDVDFSSTHLTTLDYQQVSQSSHSFHVHWHFVNSTIPTESYINDIKMENIWQDAEKAEIANVETLVMAPHHFLIHLSEHALRVRHSLSKLSFYCDIDEVIHRYWKTLDWDRLLDESLDFNLSKFVYLSLYFTSKFLMTEIHQDVFFKLKPRKFSLGEKIFMKSISKNNRSSGLSYLVHLSMNKGFKKKIKFVWKTFFPPRQIMAQRHYSPRSKWILVYYFRRIVEVFSRLPRILK